MNNLELIDYVFKNSDVQKKDVKIVLEKMVLGIHLTLRRGGAVTLAGVGKLEVVRFSARIRRNPKTQALINVPSAKKPKFRPAGELVDVVNGR